MLKIGEFSKLAHLTVKTLRFYEKKGILLPKSIDASSGYRFYETSQLKDAAKIKAYRQLKLSIEEIQAILSGKDERIILRQKAEEFIREKQRLDVLLSTVNHILEDCEMKYPVTEKIIPKTLVYSSETVLHSHQDIMRWIPAVGEACLKLNPDLKCAEPPYEFCEYMDGEHKERDIRIRHSEAVTRRGNENDIIRFRELPETKVLSLFHNGSYDTIAEAYAYLYDYAERGGYQIMGPTRECYIDGIWNKESPEDWLTEIQLPIQES